MYYYTDITWIHYEYSDCMTGKNDRVLSRIYMDYFLVRDQSNSLTYSWELTECNNITDQSFCDQYIVTSGRYNQCKKPLTQAMPPPRSVLWSHFRLVDGKLWKQLTFFILWCLRFFLFMDFLINTFIYLIKFLFFIFKYFWSFYSTYCS